MHSNANNNYLVKDSSNKTNNSIATTERMLGRALPFNVEAERAVLGSLLLHDGQFDIVVDLLEPQDFYNPSHRVIYESMVAIFKRGQKIDLLTLQDNLTKVGLLEQAGGIVYLVSLQEEIPAIGLIEQHAQIIKEKATLRQLIDSAASIISNCYAQDQREISAVLDEAERAIFNISQKKVKKGFIQLDIWVKKAFEYLNALKTNNKDITGIATGYRHLDKMTSGWQKSDLIVLAARPSMGKTALALSLARNAAVQDMAVGFFSLEMSAEQLTLRLLAAEAGVPHHLIRNGDINSDDWVNLTDHAARLGGLKLFIDDTATQTVMDIRAKARKLKVEHDVKFIVIDYLQLIRGHKKYENRNIEVSEISRSLKALAKELNIPVLALSQLSRAVESRVDKKPMLSDLRESGAIEQDADVIMFLYRDKVYNPETENPNLAELILGKQRNGPTGTVELYFQNELTLFLNLDKGQPFDNSRN